MSINYIALPPSVPSWCEGLAIWGPMNGVCRSMESCLIIMIIMIALLNYLIPRDQCQLSWGLVAFHLGRLVCLVTLSCKTYDLSVSLPLPPSVEISWWDLMPPRTLPGLGLCPPPPPPPPFSSDFPIVSVCLFPLYWSLIIAFVCSIYLFKSYNCEPVCAMCVCVWLCLCADNGNVGLIISLLIFLVPSIITPPLWLLGAGLGT